SPLLFAERSRKRAQVMYRRHPLLSFVCLLAFGAILTTGSWGAQENAETDAVKRLEEMGADLIREPNRPDGAVIKVSLWTYKVTDEALKDLLALPHLAELNVSAIRDTGLKHLSRIKSLEELRLRSDEITDAGLKELVRLPNLRALILESSKVTEAGLACL